MKRFASILLCVCWLIAPAWSQQIKLSALPVTNGIAGADLSLLDTYLGNGVYTTRTVAFSNWFNFQIFLPSAAYVSGGTGTTFYGPRTTNGQADSTPNVSSSPWTSGSFWTAQMTSTNGADGWPQGTNLQGYYVWDPESTSIGAVGLQAVETNLPGFNLWVGNGEPTAIASSGGTAGNIPWIAFDSGSSLYHGGTPGDTITYFPYLTNTTAHRMWTSTFHNAGTNTRTFTADGLLSMLRLDESQGEADFAGTAAKFSNTVTFAGTGNNTASIASANGAYIVMPCFVLNGTASITNGFWGSTGPGQDGWSWNSGAWGFVAGGTRQCWMDNTGVYPTAARNNTLQLGETNQTWSDAWRPPTTRPLNK